MPYRDDRDYLRARIAELEEELAQAHQQIADLEESARLRDRAASLEWELREARGEIARLRPLTADNSTAVMRRLIDETRALERTRDELRERVRRLQWASYD